MGRLIKLGGGLLDSGNLGTGKIKMPEGIILLDTGTSDNGTGTTIIMRPNNGFDERNATYSYQGEEIQVGLELV